jgi:hypothetical protein
MVVITMRLLLRLIELPCQATGKLDLPDPIAPRAAQHVDRYSESEPSDPFPVARQ